MPKEQAAGSASAASARRAVGISDAGFTLAEVLAALVFMAIVIPVALEGLSLASRAGEVSARKCDAAFVAERILNENIVTTNWDKMVTSGTVRQGTADFKWSLRHEPWNEDVNQDGIRLLSVEVAFEAQGIKHAVKLSTLIDSASPLTRTNYQ